jgi:hypothetical protein
MARIMLALVTAATLLLPATASARPHDCGPASARTILRSAAVRVYYTQRGAKKDYFACWRRTHGKPVNLTDGGIERPEFVSQFRLRGRYITFVYTSCAPGSGCDSFVVHTFDVKARRGVAATDYLEGRVVTLVATRGGAAAFLATNSGGRYIQRLDSLGVEQVDSGADLRSLTLHGSRLHWLHGTEPRDEHIAHVRRCGPVRHADTVALSTRIRVYSIYPYGDGEEARSYACLLGGGAPLFLGQDSPLSTLYSYHYDFHLRGHHVVWLEYECYMGCVAKIHSADLQRRTKRAGKGYHDEPTAVLVNSRGFAAELLRSEDSATSYKILGFDSRGETQLDPGPGIDPNSIAIFADAVVWRHDGELRSAPLR